MEEKIPVIIPLGCGSTHHNEELRMLLRSMERNAVGLGEVFLVTTFCPSWIDQSKVVVVPIPDKYPDCKDGCIFHKIHETLRLHLEIGRFVFSADDNVFCKPIELDGIPRIRNHRPNGVFQGPGKTKWQRRVARTLEWAKSVGAELPNNLESHCPQLFDGNLIRERMDDFQYYPDDTNGKTITTTWAVMTDSWRNTVDQRNWKETHEMPCTAKDVMFDKPFMSYNDIGFSCIREELFRRFHEPSRYERI